MKKQLTEKKSKLEIGLLKGLKEAVAFEQGKINLRTTTIEIPDVPPTYNKNEVKKVREQLNVSQPVFAKILGVSDGAVKAWESGANKPSGSSARLIQMAKLKPHEFKVMLQELSK